MRLLAAVAVTITSADVEDAARRGRLLERLGLPVLPIAAGEEIGEVAQRLADELGVATVLASHRLGRLRS